MADEQSALDAMVREALGLDPDTLGGSPYAAGGTSFVLFALGAINPLVPFFFASGTAAVVIGDRGGGRGPVCDRRADLCSRSPGAALVFSGTRQLVFGLVAAGLTFGLGLLIGMAVKLSMRHSQKGAGTHEHLPHRGTRDPGTERVGPLRPSATTVGRNDRCHGPRGCVQLSGPGPRVRGQHDRQRRLLGLCCRGGHGFSIPTSWSRSVSFGFGSVIGGRIVARYGHHRGRHLASAMVVEAVFLAAAVVLALWSSNAPQHGFRYALDRRPQPRHRGPKRGHPQAGRVRPDHDRPDHDRHRDRGRQHARRGQGFQIRPTPASRSPPCSSGHSSGHCSSFMYGSSSRSPSRSAVIAVVALASYEAGKTDRPWTRVED